MQPTNSQKVSITVPLTITFEIGSPGSSPQRESLDFAAAASLTPADESQVLQKAKQAFGSKPGVLGVRMGYVFRNGWITSERAIVVTVQQRQSIRELQSTGNSALPNRFMDYPVEITSPTLEQLLQQSAGDTLKSIASASREAFRESRYFPPDNIKLEKVSNEKMKVRVDVSPENGWNDLKAFLEQTEEALTIAMYDFGAPHIVETIEGLAGNGSFRAFLLTLQPGQDVGEGTKKDDLTDEDTVSRFQKAFGDKFSMAWIHIGSRNGWVNSSYHIKVAVRDSKATHVSSGNYQSSNEPDVASMTNPDQAQLLRTYNREWNAMIEHEGIAKMYEGFIKHDYKNNQGAERESYNLLEDFYLLVPGEAATQEAIEPEKPFQPLEREREFTVTPLLTPDNYFDEVIAMIGKAEKELYIQNQTFNAPKEGQDKLDQFVSAVLEKQKAGVDVKIIFRSIMASTARANVEALVEMGFDAKNIKTHPKVHTKGIVVDNKYILLGSQNISNDGISVNRDASLLFDDAEVADYFRTIFLHDWEKMAKYSVGRESVNPTLVKGRPESIAPNMEIYSLKDLLETL